MDINDILTRVKRQFGDESGVQLGDADIIRWINDAQRDIAMKHDLLQTKATSSIVAAQADYTVPADLLNLFGVRYDNRRLVEYSIQEVDLDGLAATNATASDTPNSYSFFADLLTLYPTPAVALTNGLTILYLRQPTEVVTVSDPLTLPERYHNSIVQYCLQMAYELDENWQAAQVKNQEFNSDMGSLRGKLEAMPEEFYPHVSYVSDDYYDGGWHQ